MTNAALEGKTIEAALPLNAIRGESGLAARRTETGDGGKRCTECYDIGILGVCCTCGKYLCARCSPSPSFLGRIRPGILPAGRGKTRAILCREHIDTTVSPTAILILSALAVSVTLSLAGFPKAMWSLLLPLTLAAAKRHLDALSFGRDGKRILPHWVSPTYKVTVLESARLDFILGSKTGSYSQFSEKKGLLTFAMKEKAKSGLGDGKPVDKGTGILHCGFIRPDFPKAGTRLMRGHDSWTLPPDRALLISGPRPAGFETAVDTGAEFGTRFAYGWERMEPHEEADPSPKLPFWILPRRLGTEANARHWGLEFVIADPKIGQVTLKRLVLHIPAELDGIESTDGAYEGDRMQISWQNLKVISGQGCGVYVQFKQPLRRARILEASYTAVAEGFSLSGIDLGPGGIWGPDGFPAKEGTVAATRSVQLEGSIRIDARLQLVRQEFTRQHKCVFPGLMLTNDVAHEVIKCLADRDVYAKYVFEAPPVLCMGDEGAYYRRYWEIIGRHYLHYHPFDVHAILTGKQPLGSQPTGVDADCNLELIVRSHSQHGPQDADAQENRRYPEETQQAEALSQDILNAVDNALVRRNA